MSSELASLDLESGVRAFCKRAWWAFLVGGIASVIFGILAFAMPGIALLVLSLFFAAALLIDGVANAWGAITHRDRRGWWLLLIFGLLGIVAGGYLLAVPPASMLVFIWLVAFIALLTGFTVFSLGWRIRKEVEGEWVLYLTGAVSVLFGLLILFRIDIGGLSVVYFIATWALIVGVLRIMFALRIRQVVSERASGARVDAPE